jgi:hypothetical protein
MTPMLGSKLRRDVRCNHRPMRLRPLSILLALVFALGLLAGCGGGDDSGGNEADSSTDATQLLKDTFTGKKDIKSGKLDIKAEAASGGQTVAARLSGPFQSNGSGKVPDVDIDATLDASGQNFNVGVTTTSDKAFVSYQGTDYEIPPAIMQGLQAQYEQSAKQNGNQQSLASLGIDPSKWLTNAKNEGEAKVGDTDTIKITGDVDVPKLLDDVNNALSKIRALGGAQAANIPDQLSEKDKQQATDAIKDLNVEVYTGADDKIMRRLVIDLKLQPPGQSDSADVKFDMQFLDLNEDQEIKAPDNAKPFTELAQKLQGLGLGGGLGALGGSSGSAGSGASDQNLEKYSQCIQDANGAPDKIRKCGDLLTP